MDSLWLGGGRSDRGCGYFLVGRTDPDQLVRGHCCLQWAGWWLQLALQSKTGELTVAISKVNKV